MVPVWGDLHGHFFWPSQKGSYQLLIDAWLFAKYADVFLGEWRIGNCFLPIHCLGDYKVIGWQPSWQTF